MEALKKGRKVMHSELLATVADGGRVSVFQFTTVNYGLLILAYINDDKIIAKEFISDNIHDGKVDWRADAGGDNICLFEVQMLCKTDAGLVIGFLWHGPEATITYLLVEKEGKFIDFISEKWYYNHWEDEFYLHTTKIINAELWPELDASALIGAWEGERDLSYWKNKEEGEEIISYTFRVDGSGEHRSYNKTRPITTYYVDGNIIIYTVRSTSWDGEDFEYTDLYRIKIEGNQLFLESTYGTTMVLTKK
jgi:hypothetical protein